MGVEESHFECHMRDLFNRLQEQDKRPIQELLRPTGRVDDCYNTINNILEGLAFNPNISNTGIFQHITECVRNKIEEQKVQKNFSDIRDDYYNK